MYVGGVSTTVEINSTLVVFSTFVSRYCLNFITKKNTKKTPAGVKFYKLINPNVKNIRYSFIKSINVLSKPIPITI